jgi:hypothetical protein
MRTEKLCYHSQLLILQRVSSVVYIKRPLKMPFPSLSVANWPGMSIAVIAGNLAFSLSLDVPLTSVLSTQFFTL